MRTFALVVGLAAATVGCSGTSGASADEATCAQYLSGDYVPALSQPGLRDPAAEQNRRIEQCRAAAEQGGSSATASAPDVLPSTTRVPTAQLEQPLDRSGRIESVQRTAENVCQAINEVLVAEWEEGDLALVAPVLFENLAGQLIDASDAWADQFPSASHNTERNAWTLAVLDEMVRICPEETDVFTSILSLG